MKGNQKSFELTPLAAALAGAVAAFAMQGASAQGSQPVVAATGQAAPVTLERVTVTGKRDDGYKVEEAQSPKFTAPLLDTPKSVTVVPTEVIRQSGSNSLQDALRTTPGITFGAGEGGNPIGDRPFIAVSTRCRASMSTACAIPLRRPATPSTSKASKSSRAPARPTAARARPAA
ncbi:TonB-dependent receptor plug domain-containing protein [Cupriavidus sp. a3]|uniref:TonB-dependent receptor plug domain-containing protein n=1 Tax=Cupriavidus sp. a3 TaxID=3242158 RepID=UPI003D9C384E